MARFEFNKAGMKKLEDDLIEQFPAGIRIPLDGSEDAAIRSVTDQLAQMGVMPNESEIREMKAA